MTVTCCGCGTTWPRDPALGVACPRCHAPVGGRCKRPSGHGCDSHVERDGDALAAGLIQPCPGARRVAVPVPGRPAAMQGVLL